MIYFFEAVVFVGYSFLAPIVTAGGGLLVTNVLSLGNIELIRAAGLTSIFFLFNGFIVVSVFRKDIVWGEVKRFLPLSIVGSVLGAIFLIHVNPLLLLSFMLFFSLYFIYEKVKIAKPTANTPVPDSFLKEQSISLFSGVLQGTALPGGGFRNAYFLSKGLTLSQMHGTTNFIGIFLWVAKITTLISATVLTARDFIGIAIALPFLVASNHLLRRGLITLPKKMADTITIFAMSILSLYAATAIATSFF